VRDSTAILSPSRHRVLRDRHSSGTDDLEIPGYSTLRVARRQAWVVSGWGV
jgi:hypothetical protein